MNKPYRKEENVLSSYQWNLISYQWNLILHNFWIHQVYSINFIFVSWSKESIMSFEPTDEFLNWILRSIEEWRVLEQSRLAKWMPKTYFMDRPRWHEDNLLTQFETKLSDHSNSFIHSFISILMNSCPAVLSFYQIPFSLWSSFHHQSPEDQFSFGTQFQLEGRKIAIFVDD